MNLTPEQRTMFKEFVKKHAQSEGDLSYLYRIIGELLEENETLKDAIGAWVELDDGAEPSRVDSVCDNLNAIYKRFKDVS